MQAFQSQKSYFDYLPDYMVESYIFPYLNSKELFYIIRAVNPEWHEDMKNVWGGNIKEEMLTQIKNISFIYEKDAIAKAYEFKLQYLINYYNLLTIYNTNANVFEIIQLCAEYFNEPQIVKMISLFFLCLKLHDFIVVMNQDNLDTKTNEMLLMLGSEDNITKYKETIDHLLNINFIFMNDGELNQWYIVFNELNKEFIENLNENCKLVYSFLQGIIEYQLLKSSVKELKEKFEFLSDKIMYEAKQWPKRKRFVETAYKFLLFTKSSNYRSNHMLRLFEKYKIKSPLIHFKEESYKMLICLKEHIVKKKADLLSITNDQIQLNNHANSNEGQENNSEEDHEQEQDQDNQDQTSKSIILIKENINEMILKNLFDKRLLLSKKIMLLEKFYIMYKDCADSEDSEICNVKNTQMPLKNFLISLIIASQTYEDKFNIDTIVQIKDIIDNNYTYDIKPLFYDDNELEKQKEIQSLKDQKQSLQNQKEKTQQVLLILKKYLILKENLAKNKKKYKLVLYLLSKIRKGEAKPMNEAEISLTIQDVNLEEIDFDNEDISETEKGELDNFEATDQLLKEIEESISKQINTIFSESNSNSNKTVNCICNCKKMENNEEQKGNEENDKSNKDNNNNDDDDNAIGELYHKVNIIEKTISGIQNKNSDKENDTIGNLINTMSSNSNNQNSPDEENSKSNEEEEK